MGNIECGTVQGIRHDRVDSEGDASARCKRKRFTANGLWRRAQRNMARRMCQRRTAVCGNQPASVSRPAAALAER
jgi:hypothetical protein